MKHSILAILLSALLLLMLSSCADTAGGEETSREPSSSTSEEDVTASVKETETEEAPASSETDGREPASSAEQPPDVEPPTRYDVLNALAKRSYATVGITVVTETGDVSLTTELLVCGEEVSYTAEQLRLLPTDGKLDSLDPSPKVTVSGTAILSGGTLIGADGKEIPLASGEVLTGRFHFEEDHFTDVHVTDTAFSGEVTDVAAFLGRESDISELSVELTYTEEGFEGMLLQYRTEKSSVTVTYLFG